MLRARVDANQSAIVEALRAIGCSVQPLHRVGQGVPDLLVGRHRRNWLIEIKNGKLPAYERELNDLQIEWHTNWRGQVAVVNSVDEALALVNAHKLVSEQVNERS